MLNKKSICKFFLPIFYHNLLEKYVSFNKSYHHYYPNLNVILLSKRNSSFYKWNYNNELEVAVNKQIESEKLAAEIYLALAVKFLHPSVAYMGAGGFFMKMYEEELGHMKQFINYQLTRGGTPILHCKSTIDKVTLLDAFSKALDMEKNITKQLQELVCVAETNCDHQCADFVCSKFLGEQMVAINELAQHVTRLKTLGDNKHAMYHFDLQLTKLYPYSLK